LILVAHYTETTEKRRAPRPRHKAIGFIDESFPDGGNHVFREAFGSKAKICYRPTEVIDYNATT